MVISKELVDKCISIMDDNLKLYTATIPIDIQTYQQLQKECIYDYSKDDDCITKMHKFTHLESKYFTLYIFNKTKEVLDTLRLVQDIILEYTTSGDKHYADINFLYLTINEDKEKNTVSLELESGIACMGFVNSIRGNVLRIISEITCAAVYSIPRYKLIFDIVVLGDKDYPDTSIKFCDEMVDSIAILKRQDKLDTYMVDREITTSVEIATYIGNEEIIYVTVMYHIKDEVYKAIPELESLYKLKLTIPDDLSQLVLEAIND